MPKDLPLPCSLEFERLVLGLIILKAEDCQEAFASLHFSDFSLEKHSAIFKRLVEMREAGTPIDRITLYDCITRHGEGPLVGGLSYLVSLDDGAPQEAQLAGYVRGLREKAVLRQTIFETQKIQSEAWLGQREPGAILSQAIQDLARLDLKLGGAEGLLSPGQIFDQYGGLDRFVTSSIKPGIPCGFPQVDELLYGLAPQGQYVIAGQTRSGKSALAHAIMLNIARQGYSVGLFSLEMSKEQIMARLLCTEAEVPLRAYLTKQLMPDQKTAIQIAAARLNELPFFIDDKADLSISELVTRVTQAVAHKKIKMFVLDHLHILNWRGDRELRLKNEYEGFTYASGACRMLARRNDIISIVLAQLNRPKDKKKKDEKPTLEDLRATGMIEADAFGVLMIYRAELAQPGDHNLRERAEILVRKARMGQDGVAKVRFLGKYTKFIDDGVPFE